MGPNIRLRYKMLFYLISLLFAVLSIHCGPRFLILSNVSDIRTMVSGVSTVFGTDYEFGQPCYEVVLLVSQRIIKRTDPTEDGFEFISYLKIVIYRSYVENNKSLESEFNGRWLHGTTWKSVDVIRSQNSHRVIYLKFLIIFHLTVILAGLIALNCLLRCDLQKSILIHTLMLQRFYCLIRCPVSLTIRY